MMSPSWPGHELSSEISWQYGQAMGHQLALAWQLWIISSAAVEIASRLLACSRERRDHAMAQSFQGKQPATTLLPGQALFGAWMIIIMQSHVSQICSASTCHHKDGRSSSHLKHTAGLSMSYCTMLLSMDVGWVKLHMTWLCHACAWYPE